MNAWVAAWQFARIARWALWIGFVIYSFYFAYDRAPHFTSLGQLTLTSELALFGLSGGAVFAGLMELACRARVTPAVVDPQR
jgi:hypothetical protein